MTDNPAKFSKGILEIMEDHLRYETGLLLDPFAGTGRIHTLQRDDLRTMGIELEPEWADLHERTAVGDALKVQEYFPPDFFDVIATSPTYGNRMADKYDGRDGSKRYTYRTALDRDLSEGSSAGLQWGTAYRKFHVEAWFRIVKVLKPGGLFVLNISDHVRKGKRQYVTDFHLHALRLQGLIYERGSTVFTPRNRNGRNAEARIPGEQVISLRKKESE